MIDDSDGDGFCMLSLVTPGWLGVVFLVMAAVFYAVAYQNAEDCSKKQCTAGQATVVAHECVCLTPAR